MKRVLFAALLLMTTFNLNLYGKQFEFAVAPQHYTALIGGIGSGKSQGGGARAVLASQGQIGTTKIRTPNLGVVTAPTYNILRDASLRTFQEVAGDLIDYKSSSFSAPMRVRMMNGSEVLFRSADNPEHLRGPNASWWWGDEAALYGNIVWRIMIGRLREFGGHGYAWLTTTPKGRNWIWQRFVQKATDQYRFWKVRTRDNPFLDEDFIASLEEDYGDSDFAKQELLGDFIAFEGLVYPEFQRDAHVAKQSQIPASFPRVVAGVDWGFVNPGVINVYGITADNRMYLVHEEYARKRGIDEWADIARQLRDIWNIQAFYCDPSEPDYIRKFNEKGCKAVAANNTVSTGIQAVKRRLAKRADGLPGLLYYPGAVWNMTENEQYQWAKKGDTLLDQPLKANDHTRDPERYVVMAVDPVLKPIVATAKRYV